MAGAEEQLGALEIPKGRFYEKEFPELEDIVVVKVNSITQNLGAYCTLLEYDGQEGMLLLSELSKRRIRSVAKLLKVGRTECCCVLRADQDKGYIDLSKRRVDLEDKQKKEDDYAKAKAVHGIMRHVSDKFKLDLEDFCTKFSWPLYRKYGNAFDPYRQHINEDINIWDDLKFNEPGDDLSHLEKEIKEAIEDDLRRKLVTQIIRIQAKIDVSCTAYEGIEAIKAALKEGLETSTEECEVKIKLIAHPTFMLTCMCREKPLGIKALLKAMEKVKGSIEAAGGEYAEKQPPTAMNDNKEDNDDDDGSQSGSDSSGSEKSDMGGLDEETEKQLKKMQEEEE